MLQLIGEMKTMIKVILTGVSLVCGSVSAANLVAALRRDGVYLPEKGDGSR